MTPGVVSGERKQSQISTDATPTAPAAEAGSKLYGGVSTKRPLTASATEFSSPVKHAPVRTALPGLPLLPMCMSDGFHVYT